MNDDPWDFDSDLLVNGFPPPSSTMHVEFGADSRCARGRSVNEDHYLIIELGRHQQTLLTSLPETAIGPRFEEHGYAMIVADGMGGSGAGETASRLAVTTLLQLALYYGRWNLRVSERIAQEILERADRFYRHVDSAVTFEGVTGSAPDLQTTLTAAFSAGHDVFFAHVGHSRAYLWRAGQLMRLTRDHTLGQRHPSRVSMAPLVDVNATSRDLKHVLTGAMGMADPSRLHIDLERLRLHSDDVVLVCTNGVTDALDESEIADVLKSAVPPAEQSRMLVDRAIESDGRDDATALVGHYHFP